ncbi:MAG: methylated-DNA--[protein]-cysteine S-methyltransferase [Vulcanimicrobiaceae bacterium]
MILADLRRLAGERAPEGFAADVMRAAGLVDRYALLPSPIGPVYVAWNGHGIAAVMRADGDAAFEAAFAARFARPAVHATEAPRAVTRALAGLGEARRLTYDLRVCTPFEAQVLGKVLEIPRGQIRPYAWIAREIGKPKAVRAVGSALARNPVPLLIPCHRVVRSDGKVGEYALGVPRKVTMLDAEGVDVAALEGDAQRGVRLHGSRTTKIYCFPTCADARRTKPEHAVAFRSEQEAHAAGYRPCKHCRPAAA